MLFVPTCWKVNRMEATTSSRRSSAAPHVSSALIGTKSDIDTYHNFIFCAQYLNWFMPSQHQVCFRVNRLDGWHSVFFRVVRAQIQTVLNIHTIYDSRTLILSQLFSFFILPFLLLVFYAIECWSIRKRFQYSRQLLVRLQRVLFKRYVDCIQNKCVWWQWHFNFGAGLSSAFFLPLLWPRQKRCSRSFEFQSFHYYHNERHHLNQIEDSLCTKFINRIHAETSQCDNTQTDNAHHKITLLFDNWGFLCISFELLETEESKGEMDNWHFCFLITSAFVFEPLSQTFRILWIYRNMEQ